MTHPYLHSLCVEYVELVDSMRGGMHDDHHALDSQRQITHNQLLEITGLTRADDMYLYAKQVLADQAKAPREPQPNARVKINKPGMLAHGRVGWFVGTNSFEREIAVMYGDLVPTLIWYVDTPVGNDDVDHWWVLPGELIEL